MDAQGAEWIAPGRLGPAGTHLWSEITDVLELDAHEAALLLEACRVADRLDGLHEAIADGVMVDGKPNPVLVEARQQQQTLARLVASLRLPEDLREVGSRPQRRGAARGAYLRGVS